MLDRAPIAAATEPEARSQTVIIGSGKHGRVELDVTRNVVAKHYNDSDAASVMQREHDILSRFGQALAGQTHVRCPQALDIDHSAGTLQMTYCAGTPIDELLADPESSIDNDLNHIARQVHIAMTTFVGEFGTPYYDLAPWNMLYQPETRILSMVDFASDGYFGQRFDHIPVEASLGKLTGGSLYQVVRPANWRNSRYRDRQRELISSVLALVRQHDSVDLSRVAALSALTYNAMGKQGRFTRQLWYRTVGHVLYTRRITNIMLTVGQRIDSRGIEHGQ